MRARRGVRALLTYCGGRFHVHGSAPSALSAGTCNGLAAVPRGAEAVQTLRREHAAFLAALTQHTQLNRRAWAPEVRPWTRASLGRARCQVHVAPPRSPELCAPIAPIAWRPLQSIAGAPAQ